MDHQSSDRLNYADFDHDIEREAEPQPDAPKLNRHQRRRANALRFLDPAKVCRPITVREAGRLMRIAEKMEVGTKARGKRNGALGYTGLRVLKALVYHFMNRRTGACYPSYAALMEATGLCRQAVANALCRLEETKLVTVTRRLVRKAVHRLSPLTGAPEVVHLTVQGTNLYNINIPAKGALIPLPWRASRRKPKAVLAESARTTGNQSSRQADDKKRGLESLNAALQRMATNVTRRTGAKLAV